MMKRTRAGIAATGIAVALAVASPDARAHGWPGTNRGLAHFEVDVPAGALPPGGAVAETSAGANRYRIRFEMPAAGSTRISLWNDLRLTDPAQEKQEVVVRSDRGGTFRTAAEASRESDDDGPPLFLGSADELAAFVKAAAPTALATPDPTTGIELGARAELAAPDCRRLAHARYVAAVLAEGASARGVLACAARGASLIVVGRLEGAADPETSTFARLSAGTSVVAWGFGAVAWLPNVRADVAGAIARVTAAGRKSGIESTLHGWYWTVPDDGAPPAPKGVPGSTLVLVLLALYVAVIGPIGYLVGVRPRRAWLAWGWFPMVALAATIALAAGSALWRGQAAELAVSRVSLVAPTGIGLEAGRASLQGSSSQRYSISLPWRDGDLRSIDRGYRFGTPFSSPAGALAVTDDRIGGRLAVDGLAVGRYATATVEWIAAAERRGAEVSARGDKLTVLNRAARPLRRAVVRSARLCAAIEEVPAGGARTVAGGDCGQLRPPGSERERTWPAIVTMNVNNESPPEGSFVLVAETGEPVASVEAAPAIRVTGADILVVRGPLAEAEGTP